MFCLRRKLNFSPLKISYNNFNNYYSLFRGEKDEAKKRNRFTTEEKVEILKQHLLEKKALSDLCDKYKIHPTMFYRWQKDLFSNAEFAFNTGKDKESEKWKKKTFDLEKKLVKKNEVVSELMEEYITLKKNLGES